MNTRPRRPAQMTDEQIDSLPGDNDVAYNSELAHSSAQALVPMGRNRIEYDETVRSRILNIAKVEGVDVLAQLWTNSPADTLPGILWRGFLLTQWIERDYAVVTARFLRGKEKEDQCGELSVDVSSYRDILPEDIAQEWRAVFSGSYDEHFDVLLSKTAYVTFMCALSDVTWIENDADILSTYVTRRSKAMAHVSRDFYHASRLVIDGELE
ncbi:MAG: hypothetical protein J6M18_01300 [Actinomycetaceae bacterium]|nr:hypothetical protein [Actinomycetaceae bacterium]